MLHLTNSFTQNVKFGSKTAKFSHVTPSDVAQIMTNHNFELISLKTGHAKLPDRASHQTTFARYRHLEALDNTESLKYDIIVKIPHLYGSISLIAGIFRLVCKNGLVTGQSVESFKVPHIGDAPRLVSESIEQLVARRSSVLDTVSSWSKIGLSDLEAADLAISGLRLRAPNLNQVSVETLMDMLKTRREADAGNSLWNVYNRIQEALTKYNFRYEALVDSKLVESTTRRLLRPDSEVAVGFNRDLFDLASRFGGEVKNLNNINNLAIGA